MKNKLFVFKHTFSTALTVVCVQAGSYLKEMYRNMDNAITLVIFLAFVYIISYKIPGLIAYFIMKLRIVRKYLSGKNFVEGYWYFKGYDNTPAENKLDRDGIGQIEYNSEEDIFEITVTRLNDDYSDTFETHSKSFIIIDKDCVNQFSCNIDGKEITGISAGTFSISNQSRIVNVYNGKIMTHDNLIVKQKGMRIDDLVVKSYEKRYGDDWMKNYLSDQKRSLRNTA